LVCVHAYLLPDFEDDEEQASFIRFRAKKLFEHELEAWCTDTGKWPSVRNHKAFFAWFRVEVSPVESPIETTHSRDILLTTRGVLSTISRFR
jgi:hypothetical protein